MDSTELIKKIESIIKEAEMLKTKTIEEKGSSFLRIPNKDILLWLATKQINNDKEIEGLKVKFQLLTVILTGVVIAIIGGHIL